MSKKLFCSQDGIVNPLDRLKTYWLIYNYIIIIIFIIN